MDCAAKRVTATTLFIGIRQFNKIANILSLEETHAFLNDFYRLVVDSVLNRNGSVNKFIGDAVLAVFGAPTAHENDSYNAVHCAIDIRKSIDEVNITWRKPLNFLVEIDCGITTGEILAGTVGHVKKLEYTVIGKKVNLAARLVHLCKEYNVEILIENETHECVKDVIACKDLGEKLILGFPEPVSLFTPIQVT
jgi:adenylate cyclase